MRTLCVNLQSNARNPAVAENFLTFSPRVHYRDPGLVFADISSTVHLFGSEEKLMDEVLALANDFYPDATAAIADSPSAAQVFSRQPNMYIVPPTHEREQLEQLPLRALNHLEGLIAWRSVREIEDIVDFFQNLGLAQIAEIQRFDVEAFRERWGDTGSLLWRRLHGLDRQVISPLVPAESLVEYVHLDFPVSLLPFLLHCVEKSLKNLFARLQGRGEFAQKVQLHLYCEYSERMHLIEVQPASPNRDLELAMNLIENKLNGMDLENPIRQFEVEVVSVPERLQQFDFFEPRVRDQDKLQNLMSLFHQSELHTGYFKPQDEILPENSWQITTDYEAFDAADDSLVIDNQDGHSFQLKTSYSHHIQQAPRPSRLLTQPKPLSDNDVRKLKFLSQHPIERLEDSWWETSRGRDYYVALSQQGQTLWVFLDRIEDRYYLHGYFD